mmetsp:Transcript_32396/g.29201  ORF Transcript_32396/g.29201 Transcript_32396/m.29201 type:complete len:161 (+) Transcript_32396:37-519(+)
MQEVESKRKLTPADGAHIFYTAIFLTGAFMVKTGYNSACTADLATFLDFLFYGLLLWATFLIITLVPRYKNEGLRLFFNLLDILYGLFHIGLVIYTASQYFKGTDNNDCATGAPELNFLAGLYVYVTGVTAGVIVVGFFVWFVKRFIRPNDLAGFHKADI